MDRNVFYKSDLKSPKLESRSPCSNCVEIVLASKLHVILSYIAHRRCTCHVVVTTIAAKVSLAAISLPFWGFRAAEPMVPSSGSWEVRAEPEVVGLPAHRRHVPQDALDAQDLPAHTTGSLPCFRLGELGM